MDNTFRLSGAFIASTYLLTACTSIPTPINEHFSSHIFANDNKQFTYSLQYPRQSDKSEKENGLKQKRPPPGRAEGNDRRKQKPQKKANKKQEQAMKTQASAMLDQYFRASGYCREGYWLLDQTIEHQRINLRGECNELATEADRQKFPNARTGAIHESTFPAFIALPKTETQAPKTIVKP